MENRVRFSERRAADGFRYPLTRTVVTGVSAGTSNLLGTVRAESLGEVEQLAVGNQTAVTATISVYFVPSGDSAGAANREITAMSVPGNSNIDLTPFIGGLYAAGTEIRASASMASSLIIMGRVKAHL